MISGPGPGELQGFSDFRSFAIPHPSKVVGVITTTISHLFGDLNVSFRVAALHVNSGDQFVAGQLPNMEIVDLQYAVDGLHSVMTKWRHANSGADPDHLLFLDQIQVNIFWNGLQEDEA